VIGLKGITFHAPVQKSMTIAARPGANRSLGNPSSHWKERAIPPMIEGGEYRINVVLCQPLSA
jgi:hypothetical protein